jgi:voltage-gated potassium channel
MFVMNEVLKRCAKTLIAVPITLLLFSTIMWQLETLSVEEQQRFTDQDKAVPNNIQTWEDGVWYCIVTASTVGYGDTFPVSSEGRIVGGIYIVVTLLFLATLIGNVQGAFLEARRLKELGMDGCNFDSHVLLCGWSQVSRVAITELLSSDCEIAVIVENENELQSVRDLKSEIDAGSLYVTVGDLASNYALMRAGINRARTTIVATDDDTLNMVLSINIRAINKDSRIIVYINREALRQTLQSAGVTYVTSPNELSGRLIASAAFEPEVAQLIEEVSSSQDGYDLQQFMVTDSSNIAGQSISNVRSSLLEKGGALLIALGTKNEGDRFTLTPNPDTSLVINVGDALIVMGDESQNEIAEDILRCQQGR